VLTNFGTREELRVDGVPVGRELTDLMPIEHVEGSCIVIAATDAPLLPHQLRRVAQRTGMGLARTGSYASNTSGEQLLAFSTANRISRPGQIGGVDAVLDGPGEAPWLLSQLFAATVEVTEEAVVNALVAAETSIGRDGKTLLYQAGEKPPEGPEADRPGRTNGWVDLERVKVSVRPAAEWRQMFREAWRLQREQFWVEDMSGVDWDAIYSRYLPLVDRVTTRSELSDLLWELQGELGTSHAYEIGGEYRPGPDYRQGFLGVDW